MIARFKLIAALVLLSALSAGCAPSQAVGPPVVVPVPVAKAGKGMIYAYRLSAPLGALAPDIFPDELKDRASIFLDGKLAGRIGVGEYAAIEVDPGKHYVLELMVLKYELDKSFQGRGDLTHVTPQSTHYFELRPTGEYGRVEMFERPASEASQTVASLKLHAMSQVELDAAKTETSSVPPHP